MWWDDGVVISKLHDLLTELATLIATTVSVERIAVTLPDPPSSDKCSAVHVWGSEIFDSPVGVQARGDEAIDCVVRRAYVLSYRLDYCIPVVQDDGAEPSITEIEDAAETFYDLADQIWCALGAGATGGTLFTNADCKDIVIGALAFSVDGDRASGLGTVRVTWACSPEGS